MAYNKDYKSKDLSVSVSLSDEKNELSASQESNDLIVIEKNELSDETDSSGNIDTVEEPNIQDYDEDENEEDDEEVDEPYNYTEAYKTSENSLISKIEFKVDWNLISISAIWIFLTLTYFGIIF